MQLYYLYKSKLSALAIQLISNQKGSQAAFINQEELVVVIYAMKDIWIIKGGKATIFQQLQQDRQVLFV